MEEFTVSTGDIDDLVLAVGGADLPAKPLVHSLVTALQTVAAAPEPLEVEVEVEAVPEIFETAFVATSAAGGAGAAGVAAAGRQVHVRVRKVGR